MGKKVLVVDDDPVVRILVNEFLSSQGYEVVVAEDGHSAMDTLGRDRPDVIVLDLLMPDMSGIEVLKHIRDNPSTSKLPILMMSSDLDSAVVAQSHNVTADGYVQKPFGMKDILGALDELGSNDK